jgi:micrococcal nuclease
MRRWAGRVLGVAVGLGVVAVVDHPLLDAPAWLPWSSHAREVAATERPPLKASGVAVAPARPRSDAGGTIAVARIVDGDTLTVADGRSVRLAQVDAAETGACYGSQATAALRRLTEGKKVTLRRPSQGPKTDRYGRTLADVIVNGKSVNEALVRDGAAGWYESFAREDPDLARRLAAAEADAIKARRGQWSACGR